MSRKKVWIIAVIVIVVVAVGIVLWTLNSGSGGSVYCIPNHGCFHGSRGIIY